MLVAENLTYTIKSQTVLKGVNFLIRPGEMVALLGANGAGKSTLIKLLNGEKRPTEGSIKINGANIQSYNLISLAKIRATMAQYHQVSSDFSVREIVMMGRYPHFNSVPSITDIEAVKRAMELCGISLFEERSIMSLSGGERQRVHLARVIAQLWGTRRALLLMDEPISAMDIKFQHQTLSVAKAFADTGWMVVTVLHDINLAAQYADRLILMKNGRKLMDGTASEVLNARNIYTIFGIDAEVQVNPQTLQSYVFPKTSRPMTIDFSREKTEIGSEFVVDNNSI